MLSLRLAQICKTRLRRNGCLALNFYLIEIENRECIVSGIRTSDMYINAGGQTYSSKVFGTQKWGRDSSLSFVLPCFDGKPPGSVVTEKMEN